PRLSNTIVPFAINVFKRLLSDENIIRNALASYAPSHTIENSEFDRLSETRTPSEDLSLSIDLTFSARPSSTRITLDKFSLSTNDGLCVLIITCPSLDKSPRTRRNSCTAP